MIQLSDLSLRRATTLLFAEVSCTISTGAKVGICGRNGCGKSSLFALLTGALQPDAGELLLPAGWRISSVQQEVPTGRRSAIDFVIDGDTRLRAIEAAITLAQRDGDGLKLATLHAQFEAVDGYTANARAAQLLSGLGFSQEQHEQSIDDFSGGWRMRLALAKALMCPSDLLLLDEPTNHLDLETVWWLERWLRSYRGTLLVIAHDREFLDSVVDHVLQIQGQEAHLYKGNFTAFERQHAEQLQQQASAHKKQQSEIKRIQQFVDRFRAKASKAKQAQSRLKALERMQVVSAVQLDTPFHFEFASHAAAPNPLVRARDLRIGYEDRWVVQGLRFSLRPGSRVGLIGLNGAGKSTLIKALAGEPLHLDGELDFSPGVRIGYFAQHQVEALDPEATPLIAMTREAPESPAQKLRAFLGGFAFSKDRVNQAIGTFSGGEKSRLALALLVWRRPNLLLLDEPTNHLDMDMRDALSLALQEYEGAVILVSHDRHLIRTVTDELWLVANGELRPYAGDLDDYTGQLSGDTASQPSREKPAALPLTRTDRRDQRRDEAAVRARQQPLKARAERLERQLGRLTLERQQLDTVLADASLYDASRKEELRDQLFERARLGQQIESLEGEWLEVLECLEKFE